ncbi:MAG: 50S ribosomal protein L24 [Candidatus Niyogibacteria bacterium]|nr:50S ribosomal protein L24 [Candidatus Niyogibacteria bacterium]
MKGLKKEDTVFIISGKDRGKTGKILKVIPDLNKAIVEGANMVKKHRRPRRAGEKGSIIQISMPVRVSNLMLKCSHCKKPTRRAFKILDNKTKARICKKCGAET